MPQSSIYQLSYLVTEDTCKLLVSLSEWLPYYCVTNPYNILNLNQLQMNKIQSN